MASVSRRALTPRPSISPLSAASKARTASPDAADSTAMRAMDDFEDGEMESAMDAGDAEVGGQHDDRSSSLSEPDDDHDASEEQNGVDRDIADREALAAQISLEVDSEAETERLDQTPQKLRKHPDNLGRTPSKLSQTATADDELSDPPSPSQLGAGAASSTSTIATAGQKRKRSDTADSSLTSAESDMGESPRKRKHQSTADEPLDANGAVDDAEPVEPSAERAEDTPVLDETEETRPAPVKGPKGRKGKQKGRKLKEQTEEAEPVPAEEVAETVEEPSEEDPVKTEEQRKLKKEASTVYDDVMKQFRSFKEKLYNERLASLNAELQLLAQPESLHPEYQRQVACVEARMHKQAREAHAYYQYKSRCIRDRTLGERSQLHSQYFQHVRQSREDVLYRLGEEWYAIQRERRQSHQDKDDAYIYKFPAKKSVQIRQQAKYNQEVSVLSGMAKYVGFPAAPEITGADGEGFGEDLRAMKIPRRAVQSAAAAAAPTTRPVYLPPPTAPAFTQNERLAHEQYLEQNAWARPQASIHAHGTPGISHTPDWAERPSAAAHTSSANFVRHFTGQHSSPLATTPIPQQHKQPAPPPPPAEHSSSGVGTIGLNSDGLTEGEAAPPSSVVAAAPPSVPRQGDISSSSTQASPLAFPKPRENGGSAITELAGFRNISGISGVSTIDAPPEEAEPISEERPPPSSSLLLPATLATEEESPGASQQIFDTSQIHRHPQDEKKEVYATTGFIRPPAGAFGTPAPLQAPQAQASSSRAAQ